MRGMGSPCGCCQCGECCQGVAFEWDVTVNLVNRPKNETGLPTGDNCEHCETDLSGTFALSERGGIYGAGGPCSRYYRTDFGGVPLQCEDDAYCYPATGVGMGIHDPTNDHVIFPEEWYLVGDGSLCSAVTSHVVEASVYCKSATEYVVEVAVTTTFYLQFEDQTYHSHLTNCAGQGHEETEVLEGLVGFVATLYYRKTVLISEFECDNLVDFEVPYDSKTCRCLDGYPADPEYFLCDPGAVPGAVYLNSV